MSEVWQRIANHYKDDPVILGYDLMNEPLLWSGYLDMENLIEPEYRRLTEAIRQVDTHHMLILQPPLGRFSAFGKPFDNNTAYSFHSYGATPRPEFLQQYLDFRTKYQVPIFYSEIYAERAPEWSTAHVNLAEKYNIGWMIWPYKKMAGTRLDRIPSLPLPTGKRSSSSLMSRAMIGLSPTRMHCGRRRRTPTLCLQKSLRTRRTSISPFILSISSFRVLLRTNNRIGGITLSTKKLSAVGCNCDRIVLSCGLRTNPCCESRRRSSTGKGSPYWR